MALDGPVRAADTPARGARPRGALGEDRGATILPRGGDPLMASEASPVRFAMVGGGEGAFIGPVHRTAARIAGNCRLVGGAFSADEARSRRSGDAIGLDPARVHGDWRRLIAAEAARPAAERIGFVAIVTPNHLHAPVAIAAMDAGFDVLTDKPLADTLPAAEGIADAARRTGRRVGVTHTYAGYPMVRQMRALVADGALGPVRRVGVSYTQDWLSRAEDAGASAQAAWRTDPARSGETGAFGDIGSHAAHLVAHVTGERIASIACDMRAAVGGRTLDDDGAALLRLSGGGRGTLVASQICTGDINRLDLAIYGEDAALHWRQEDPNRMTLARRGRPAELWTAGSNVPYLSGDATAMTRVPAGHPEGYLEAFANIYRAFADAVSGKDHGGYGTLDEAVGVMRVLAAARASSEADGAWTEVAA